MIGSEQKRLEVADGDMHPTQPLSGFVRRVTRAAWCWVLPIYANEASASLRTSWPSGRWHKFHHRFLSHSGDLLHGDITGTLTPVFNRHQHRISFSATPPLSTASTTYQSIVNLDQILQAVEALSRCPMAMRILRSIRLAVIQDRSICLGSRIAEIPPLSDAARYCPEPLGQGAVGGMKQRPDRERGLVMTL